MPPNKSSRRDLLHPPPPPTSHAPDHIFVHCLSLFFFSVSQNLNISKHLYLQKITSNGGLPGPFLSKLKQAICKKKNPYGFRGVPRVSKNF